MINRGIAWLFMYEGTAVNPKMTFGGSDAIVAECDCVIDRQDLVMEQSPESEHLGTTVWDSSIVVAKYFEKVIVTGSSPRYLVIGCSQPEIDSGCDGTLTLIPPNQLFSSTFCSLQNATRTRAPFSRSKVKGKSILELGSGVGLAGMAAALLGPASVTMTDTAEMLPLMRRNIEKNFGEERPDPL